MFSRSFQYCSLPQRGKLPAHGNCFRMLVILIEETAEQKAVQSAAVLPIKKIADDKFKFCRRLNFILPMANKKFAV
ncbi:MAG TPA: hypothetical protein IAA30_05225, partial [Candidatus Treponema faecavium]|nr:hypothetical protein [Candidatus Treponema faecavium]